jgi:exonuclease III
LSLYRAPSGNFTKFLNKLDAALKIIDPKNCEFIICGDFNINYLTDKLKKKKDPT